MKLILLFSLLFAGSVWTQTQILAPMPGQTATFTGNIRGYWFVAPTCFTITGADVPTDASSGNQSIAIMRFYETPPTYSTTTDAFTLLYLAQDTTEMGILPMNIQVEAGDIIGVLGCRATTVSYSGSSNTTTIEGNTVSLNRLGMQFPLTTTMPQQLWTEASSNIGRTNLYYDTLVTYNAAAVETIPGSYDFTNAADSSFISVWNYGDGSPLDTAWNPSHTYLTDGIFNACSYITNTCSTDTVCTMVAVCSTTPIADFTAQDDANGLSSFTDVTLNNPTSWFWDFGDGNTATDQNPTNQYASPGQYIVCLIATNVCGISDTICQPVDVCFTTIADFTVTTNLFTADFSDNSEYVTSWIWDFGDGNTSTINNPSHTYATTGTYTVCLVVSGDCNADTICSSVDICIPVVADFSSTINTSVDFTDNSTEAITWSWDFGDGGTSTLQSPSHTYAANGTYTSCLIASNACSADTTCSTITVCPETLQASFTQVGTDLAYTFTNTSMGEMSYSWDFGDGNTATIASPSHSYATSGVYTVCLQVMNDCGDSTESCATITVTVTEVNELNGVSSIAVYPNPFSDQTTISVQSTELEGQYVIELIDVTGKVVASQMGDFNQQIVIGKNNLLPNVYFFRISQNGLKLGTGKLIVQ